MNQPSMHQPSMREPSDDRLVVGRCYTRARRLPLMIGRLPGSSGVLWGGPYTLTQLVVFAGGVLVLGWTHGVWAHLGTGWNAAVLLGVPALLAWVVRHSRVDGRTPARALLGIAAAFGSAPGGRLLVGRSRPDGRRVGRVRFFVTPGRAPAGFVSVPEDRAGSGEATVVGKRWWEQ